MNLEEATIKYLYEAFRDYDGKLDVIWSDMYDILSSYGYYLGPNDDMSTMQIPEEIESDMYEDDINKFYDLQTKLAYLEYNKEQEYKSEISDLPKETSKTNFEGFDITKTDPPADEDFLKGNKNRDYVLKKGDYTDAYIAEMTPEQYLELCGKYGWKRRYTNIDDIIRDTPEKEDIDEYAELFKQGKKAPMPVIDIKHRGQEGRHRALACIKAGIKTMPVLVKI